MKIVILTFLFAFSVTGLGLLTSYSAQEGSMAISASQWPRNSHLAERKNFHLVVFLHPGCSCSKATLAELSRVMSQESELTARIIFMKTAKTSKLFDNNPLLAMAKMIPKAEVIFDENGIESKKFGAETSGLTHLYKNNELLFAGGLTQARGHEGDSVGKNAILSHLKNQQAKKQSLVFGCDIFGKLKTLALVGKNVKQ